jgi:hypothetical protein
MTNINEKVSTPDVSGLTVLNMKKDAVQLESLWTDRKIVLTFLRHFG